MVAKHTSVACIIIVLAWPLERRGDWNVSLSSSMALGCFPRS